MHYNYLQCIYVHFLCLHLFSITGSFYITLSLLCCLHTLLKKILWKQYQKEFILKDAVFSTLKLNLILNSSVIWVTDIIKWGKVKQYYSEWLTTDLWNVANFHQTMQCYNPEDSIFILTVVRTSNFTYYKPYRDFTTVKYSKTYVLKKYLWDKFKIKTNSTRWRFQCVFCCCSKEMGSLKPTSTMLLLTCAQKV
jgi:hypothetical protein